MQQYIATAKTEKGPTVKIRFVTVGAPFIEGEDKHGDLGHWNLDGTPLKGDGYTASDYGRIKSIRYTP